MLTQTTKNAIRALIFLGLRPESTMVSPRYVAEQLQLSPSYTAKVLQMLTRAGLLEAQRGASGGVRMARRPEEIRLLDIVQACQGIVTADFCRETRSLRLTCAFHQAMAELHQSVVSILAKWTLEDLIRKPAPSPSLLEDTQCTMLVPQE